MKKRMLLIISLAVILMLAGCQNSGTTTQDPIVGTWNWTSETVNGDPITLASVGESAIVFTFDANNTYTSVGTPISGSPTTASGTWSISGSTYTITQTTSPTNTAIATISGNTMTLSGTQNGTGYVLIATKQ